MLGWAPARVTEIAAATFANSPASDSSAPSARAVANAPFHTSPAAVVSTADTVSPGHDCSPSAEIRHAPSAPSLAMTRRGPQPRSARARPRASSAPRRRPGSPASAASSVSLGVT
jgi:hypothetical protein